MPWNILRPANLTRLLLGASCALAGSLAHALTWSPGGSPGGSGSWDNGSLTWLDDGTPSAWAPLSDADFPAPEGTVEIDGSLEAGVVTVEDDAYLFLFDNAAGDQLRVAEFSGQPQVGFTGLINAGADSYPDLTALQGVGLAFRPTGPQRFGAELLPVLGGSPVISVLGDAGRLEFEGTWNSDTGTIISWLRLEEGGHFVLTAEAEMNFIKEGFFTLQLWVHGDGSGILELEEDFVADRTEGGLVRKGIGSIRMGSGTLITHHSQSLPLGYRPRSDGTAQTNGHLVFENDPGNSWIVRGSEQVYPGAVWIFQSMEVVTETDLMHVGISEDSSNYTAQNGWSLLNPVTVTKRGPARLTLAGEQSYAAGSAMDVVEGTLSMQSDPSTGESLYGTVTGAELTLQVAEEAALEWQTDGSVQSLFLNGSLYLNGELGLQNGGLGIFGPNSRTEVLLGEDSLANRIITDSAVILDGTLVVNQLPWLGVSPGSEWIICEAASLSGSWELEDHTGLDLQLVQDATSVKLVVGPGATGLVGSVILEDDFDAGPGGWDDLSTVPLWGSPLARGTAFEWTNGVVRLRRDGTRDTTGWTNFGSANGLKTFTCLDFQFPSEVSHAGSEMTIDFRLRWPTVTDGTGEGGRFIVSLNHAYPAGGIDLTGEGEPGSRLADFSEAWWARPAYHVRLRNSSTRSGSSLLQYGGGAEPEGEYEATPNWWLPGFISGAGNVAPGAGDDYPENSWVRTREGMARNTLTSYRYRVLPDRQELWRDDNDDGFLSEDELKATMPLPQDSTAPLYQYFTTLEGLRLFWNGVDDGAGDPGQVEVDWLRVVVQENVSPVARTGEDVFARQLVEGMAPVVLDGSASTDPEGDDLLYTWLLDGSVIHTGRSARPQLELPVGEHLLELLVIDSGGNYSIATLNVSVTIGKARPVADAGPNQSVTALNDWFGIAMVDGSGSFSPTNSVVWYRWSTGIDDRILYVGPQAITQVALPVGTHTLTLTVWDQEGLFTETTTRVVIDPKDSGAAPELIYRENFTRPGDGTEKGPWAVGWDLMRFDGDPVASVKFDGNAHRSLSWDSSGNAPYQTKVNANPTGTEYDVVNGGGHMWMNQMPYFVASPAEWMLWTDEYAIDQSTWEPTTLRFYAKDGSPEQVKVAPAVRIDGQWYIGWELRILTQWNYWRSYVLPLDSSGWVLFEPSLTFSVTDATAVERLPDGIISAFGIYMYKDFGWYVNEIDNFSVWAVPAVGENAYGEWVTSAYPRELLINPANAALFEPSADPDGDGWSNLLDYAMGRSRAAPPAHGTGIHSFLDEGSLVLDLPRNPDATNISFQALMSQDLASWAPANTTFETYTDAETGQPRMRWVLPQAGQGSHFLKIEAAFFE